MTFLMLRPKKDFLDVYGKLSYDPSIGAWCTIRFRSIIVKKFSQLMEKQEKFGYRMVFLETWEELSGFLKDSAKKNEAVPMVMWLFRE